MLDVKTIDGATFAAARAMLGLNQGAFAKAMGVNPNTISALERKPAPAGQESTLHALVSKLELNGVLILGPGHVRRKGAEGSEVLDLKGNPVDALLSVAKRLGMKIDEESFARAREKAEAPVTEIETSGVTSAAEAEKLARQRADEMLAGSSGNPGGALVEHLLDEGQPLAVVPTVQVVKPDVAKTGIRAVVTEGEAIVSKRVQTNARRWEGKIKAEGKEVVNPLPAPATSWMDMDLDD